MIFPSEGLTYREAVEYWNLPLPEVIKTINNLVYNGQIEWGGIRNGQSFWKVVKTERWDNVAYKTLTCEQCGEQFPARNRQAKLCLNCKHNKTFHPRKVSNLHKGGQRRKRVGGK